MAVRERVEASAGRLAAPAVALLYRGSSIECPLCGHSFRRLRTYGRVKRLDALCPRCGSLERTRAMWLYLSENQEQLLAEGARVLHVAPDIGMQAHLRDRPAIDYVTGDLLRRDVDVRMDITAMPFDDADFDLVICSHVLEHVPDDRAAMREMRRVLRPGGRAIVMVPLEPQRDRTFEDPTVTDPAERKRLFNQSDHVRVYGADFPSRLSEAGFEVSRVDVAEELGPEPARRHALIERTASGEPNPFRSDIYLCRPS